MNFLKKFFNKKKIVDAVRETAPSVATDKPKTALDLARERILNERIQNAHKKAEEKSVEYTNRLNEHLHTYFANFSTEPSENEFAYNLLNKEWKSYVQKVNLVQKFVTLRANAFEVEVERITKENPQFQQTKTENV